MSTTTSYEDAAGFMAGPTVRTTRPKLLSTIRLLVEAIREGQIATHRYQELTRRGMAPDRAVEQDIRRDLRG